jgi:branched-subunit amino acid ABC-type transport system permease component
MLDLTHAVGFGLVTAAILAIATVAVTMQYSVTGVPNFAMGDIMTLGAYAAYTSQFIASNVVVQVVAACVASALGAFVLNRAILQPFARAGAKPLILFVATIGFALILQNVLLAIYGGSVVVYHLPISPPHSVGPFLWTERDVAIMLVAVAVLVSVHLVLRYTKFGKSQRAVANDPQLARVSGINSDWVVNVTWLWAGAITGLAGYVLAAQVGSFDHTVGFSFLLVVFAAAIVGGIGQIYGAMLGALVIGVAMEVSALYIPADYKVAVAFLALILALLFRPDGLIPAPSAMGAQL